MLRSLLLAATLILPAQSIPQTVDAPTVDAVARAKFPATPGPMVDALARINSYVNEHIQAEDDLKHYGVDELWVMYPPDQKGDCEDYALTKLGILSQAGFPIVTNAKIVGVMIHRGKEGHAILAVLLPGGQVAYLDNLNAEPMTRAELIGRGYQFFDWRA